MTEEEIEYKFDTYGLLGERFVRSERTTPVKKVIDNVKNLPEPKREAELVVLLSTGSFNPIHNGHVKMMCLAKRYMESRGFNVVGGYLSTSHLSYLRGKLGDDALENRDRVELIRLCIEGNDSQQWLFADAAECEHRRFSSIPQVLRTLEKYMEVTLTKETKRKVRVMYVCGRDLFAACHGFSEFQGDENGVVMIDRPPNENSVDSEWYKTIEVRIINSYKGKKNFFMVKNEEKDTKNLSSTEIRRKMHQGEEDEIVELKMIPRSCVDYMIKRKLFTKK